MPVTSRFLPAGVMAVSPAVLLAIILQGAPAAADDAALFDHAALARRAYEHHIGPGYAALATAAGDLSQSLDRYCADSTPAQRKAVEAAFDGFVTAWGYIEHIVFGPVTTDNRKERILFWPDRRGLGARQVARAVGARDASVLDAQTLAGKSVALQGLGALELVLFGPGAEDADPDARAYRCRYGAAIAANLAAVTHAIRDGWSRTDGFAHQWLAPGGNNPVYLKQAETTLALAKSFDQGLERVRDERLGGPLGLGPQRTKTPAVLAVSRRTMRLVRSNIDGLLHLFFGGGLKDAIISASGTRSNVVAAKADVVANELKTARGIVEEVIASRQPFEGKTARRLIAMGYPLKNARVLTGELLAETAGLTFGFNASDGD
ncbi:MAG TPA: imelysin family protein [Hyphomicrobiaceae bacterium]|nr:imelysin family protein [Hyphomicrobiaceae bacterium]